MNIPEMTPVESSNVAAVGYDGSNLFVGFKADSLYVYFDVPEMVILPVSRTNPLSAISNI